MSLRVAVIGSGPAGFYAAGSLLAADRGIDVDMIERLPTPWGLVRLGVAPDHPNIKAVSRAFEKIAARPGFRFLGNVDVGRDLAHEELVSLYDAAVYAVGAQSDRRMDVEGEDLPGSWPATAFVAWYNGHPDFQDCEFDLDVERAVVIGNGNVAVDVARMLALTPEELSPTDTTDAAIAAIAGSPVREIVMLGRRGPAQAAFTTPELKELGELAGADVIVDPADLELDPVSEAALEGDTNAQRNLEVLREYAAREPEGKGKRLVLRFLVSPVEIAGEGRVESVEVVRNRLEADARGRLAAVATDERETIPAGLVLRSVGYRGVPVPGVPFDEDRGTIRNDCGRALDARGPEGRRVYAASGIMCGPSWGICP
jgi:ferredoxin--NADP+ reductase